MAALVAVYADDDVASDVPKSPKSPGSPASAVRPLATAPVVDAVDVPALYATHWRSMVRLAVLLVDDVASAEDVVQDAFIALHKHSASLRDPNAAAAYLRASVVNLSRSVIRHRQVVRRHLKVAEPEATPGADEYAVVNDEHRAALAAVRTLPRRQREVLTLRYWSGLSEREIAATLGISQGSVKSSASRGMATLQQVLGGAL